jgi:hypothetical protein
MQYPFNIIFFLLTIFIIYSSYIQILTTNCASINFHPSMNNVTLIEQFVLEEVDI